MSNLPAIKDLYEDIELAKKSDALMVLLNNPPAAIWVKQHPFIKKEIVKEDGTKTKVPYEYLPIEVVEHLLKHIFKNYKIEITGQGIAFNGVWVTVRVHYLNPVTNEWGFHDGIGAIQMQTKAGTSPADLMNINNGAISMAFPHAKTLAVKDACDHFGKLFGSDLNRRDSVTYEADLTLQLLDETHPNWSKVVVAVSSKAFEPSAVRNKYNMTDETFEKLIQMYNGTV